MNRGTTLYLVILLLVLPSAMFSDTRADDQQTQTTTCTFDDNKEVSVKYTAAPVKNEKMQDGKAWTPGHAPMFLFTSAPLKVGDSDVPAGAYSLFVIPGKKQWTLIVNKSTTGEKHDEAQDLARVPMDLGILGSAEKEVSVVFGHLGPKQCTLRIYFGTTGAFAEIHEQ